MKANEGRSGHLPSRVRAPGEEPDRRRGLHGGAAGLTDSSTVGTYWDLWIRFSSLGVSVVLLTRALLLLALLQAPPGQREATRARSPGSRTCGAVEDGTLRLGELLPADRGQRRPAWGESSPLPGGAGPWCASSAPPACAPASLPHNLRRERLGSSPPTSAPRPHASTRRPAAARPRAHRDLSTRTPTVSLNHRPQNSRVVLAQNFDPLLGEPALPTPSRSPAIDRRANHGNHPHLHRRRPLPGQHVSLDWLEQWGDTNCSLSGLISLFDPLGSATYFRVIPPLMNTMVERSDLERPHHRCRSVRHQTT